MMWFVASALAGTWELAGLYDASAVTRSGEPSLTPPADWVWTAPQGMLASCGEPKAPDGLGVLEAQAVANGLTPTLAVVLRAKRSDAAPLGTDNVYLAVGKTRLAPMVQQSWNVISIGGDGLAAHKQLIRTQIAMESCLEHKTGRKWQGGEWKGQRQAFLLAEPTLRDPADRMFYRGQSAPVAALLGPSDACFDVEGSDAALASSVGASPTGNASSLALVPSDVWGSSLRDCGLQEVPLLPVATPSPTLPLSLGGVGEPVVAPFPTWRSVNVQIHGTSDADARIDVSVDNRALQTGQPLFQKVVGRQTEDVEDEKLGLQDVLALIPGLYPQLLDADHQYTVLLVPNWQLVEAARELPGATKGAALVDGVGWALRNPERLVLQVAGEPDGLATAFLAKKDLPNLMSKYDTFVGRLLKWGYTIGIYAGRSEIVLPSGVTPTWEQTELAQRSREHALFLGSAAVFAVLVLLGLRRLPDLWARVPEERVNYWPGAAEPAAGDGPDAATPLGDLAAGE